MIIFIFVYYFIPFASWSSCSSTSNPKINGALTIHQAPKWARFQLKKVPGAGAVTLPTSSISGSVVQQINFVSPRKNNSLQRSYTPSNLAQIEPDQAPWAVQSFFAPD